MLIIFCQGINWFFLLSAMPQVICTCSYCRKCKVTINGIEQPGKKVSAPTRQDHEKRDKQGPSKHPKKGSVLKHPRAPDPDPPKSMKKNTCLFLTDK
jgi:hypothetical protein